MNKIILPTAYFGNIEYYSLIKQADNVLIEAHEHYIKQTYRNRCEIATANGPLALTVPVKFSNTKKTIVKDVRIDYDTNWQKIHFKAIESAYRKSPFYEHFVDDFMFVFENKENYLLDLNCNIHNVLCSLLKIETPYQLTSDFQRPLPSQPDYRQILSPKIQSQFQTPKYYQGFEEKQGFLANLSVLDLLFCEGRIVI
ncbi:MAG: WbqC family protein [Bacteroidota bacterium]